MADPVPIVRTLRTTPAIANGFSLNGVVTLCDAKNLLSRLRELDADDGGHGANADEAFQQIMFADRIVLNKIDLVSDGVALEAWRRIRAINGKASIVPCVRGRLDAHQLVDVGGFDLARLLHTDGAGTTGGAGTTDTPDTQHEHGHEHGHEHDHDEDAHAHDAHEHSHDQSTCNLDHAHAEEGSAEHGHGKELHGHAPAALPDAPIVHAHDHATAAHAHNRHVGTFSLVRERVAVEPLLFARWLRKVSSAKPEEVGTLYRSKGVLAVVGVSERLVFHAVADVMEKEYVGAWPEGTTPGIKLVFIGKQLNKAWFTSTFEECLRPWRPPLQQPHALAADMAARLDLGGHGVLLGLLVDSPELFGALVVQQLTSQEATRLARVCTRMHDALLGPAGGAALAAAAAALAHEKAAGLTPALLAPAFHKKDDPKHNGLRLHGMLPLGAVDTYARAFTACGAEIVPYPGLAFADAAEVEAAGVAWEELREVKSPDESAYVIDFTWRRETIATFLAAGPTASTQSALAKLDVYNESEDEWDTLRFRLMLWPAAPATPATPAAPAAPAATNPARSAAESAAAAAANAAPTPPPTAELVQHRMVLQLVGGKTSSQIYMLSFHTIDPSFQVHVTVADHRMPVYESRETFHRYHPLMAALQRHGRVRMLVRVKPDGSAPLGDMCGCC